MVDRGACFSVHSDNFGCKFFCCRTPRRWMRPRSVHRRPVRGRRVRAMSGHAGRHPRPEATRRDAADVPVGRVFGRRGHLNLPPVGSCDRRRSPRRLATRPCREFEDRIRRPPPAPDPSAARRGRGGEQSIHTYGGADARRFMVRVRRFGRQIAEQNFVFGGRRAGAPPASRSVSHSALWLPVSGGGPCPTRAAAPRDCSVCRFGRCADPACARGQRGGPTAVQRSG